MVLTLQQILFPCLSDLCFSIIPYFLSKIFQTLLLYSQSLLVFHLQSTFTFYPLPIFHFQFSIFLKFLLSPSKNSTAQIYSSKTQNFLRYVKSHLFLLNKITTSCTQLGRTQPVRLVIKRITISLKCGRMYCDQLKFIHIIK